MIGFWVAAGAADPKPLMPMHDDPLDYRLLVQASLRDVIRRSLAIVEAEGLPPGHHFYVSFRTQTPGVVLSDGLRTRYPDEMTVVLQHQYRNLRVGPEAFTVELSFGAVWQEITVPYAAVSSFVDPEAEFGLRFAAPDEPEEPVPEPAAEAEDDQGRLAEVVSLDAFRRK